MNETDNKLDQFENVVLKSDRVVSFATPGGNITSSLYKCMNAVILALQNDVRQNFDNFDEVENVYDDRIYDIQLPVAKFIEYMEWKSNNHSGAKRAINLLKDLRVEWDVLETQDRFGQKVSGARIGFQNYVSRAEVNDGILLIRLDPDIRRTLLATKEANSLSVDLRIANGAWSDKYTPILYEHCLKYIRDGKHRFEWPVEVFREIMNVPYNLEDGKKIWSYPEFRDLRKHVIKKATENINNLELINFKVEAAPVGKPVRSIMFFIRNKVPSFSESPEYKQLKQEVLILLDEHGLENVTRKYFNNLSKSDLYFDEEITVKHLHYIKFNIEKFAKYAVGKKRPIDYYKSCLNNNVDAFENDWLVIQQQMKKIQVQEQRRKRVLAAQQREKLEKLESDEMRNYKKEVVKSYLDSLEKEEREKVLNLADKHALRKSKLIRPTTPGYEALVRIFILEEHRPDLVDLDELGKRLNTVRENFFANEND